MRFALVLIGSTKIPPITTALPDALDAPLVPLRVWLGFAETPTTPTLIGTAIELAVVFWHIARHYRRAPRDKSRAHPYKPGKFSIGRRSP